MSLQTIPLTSDPNQSFQVTLVVDEKNLVFQINIRYNDVAGCWIMTISDPKTAAIILDSVPLLPGVKGDSNILAQHSHLRIGSLYLGNVGSVSEYPTDKNLGTDFVLAWGDTELV